MLSETIFDSRSLMLKNGYIIVTHMRSLNYSGCPKKPFMLLFNFESLKGITVFVFFPFNA